MNREFERPIKKEYHFSVGQKRIQIIHKQSSIGRNPNGTVYIDEPSIAKEHAILVFNDSFEEPTLIDRGSVSGIKINNKPMPKNSKQRIYNGDFIKFGNFPLEYKFCTNSDDKDNDFSRESIVVEEKIRLAPENKDRFARIDHLGDLSQSFDQKFNKRVPPVYHNEDDVFQSKRPMHSAGFTPAFDMRQSLERSPEALEQRLRQSEQKMKSLLQQERNLMEDRVMQSLVKEQRHQLDKEMTVKQIVEDEKKILQDRFKQDMDRVQTNTMKQVQTMEQQTAQVRNKNEKLQRVLVEKEASLLEIQNQNAKLVNELKQVTQQKELLETKIAALEQYTTDLQIRHDSLQKQNEEKAQALHELMSNDLPSKLIDYKNQIQDLRSILNQKEKEKEQFIANFEQSSNEHYAKSILEKQANEIMNLQRTVEEYEKRQQQCDRKWADLLKENQVNAEQADIYKDQLEKQRETYNRLLTMTERRVIQANHSISQAYSEHGEEDKRQAAEFLSQQIYQLYEERRQLLGDNETLQLQNNELQRINIGIKIELEKYRQFVAEDFSGNTGAMIQRIEELQDLIIQQKHMTDVSMVVEAHAQIRSLNTELAKKTKFIEDLKVKIQHFNSKKGVKDLRNDEDIVEYLVAIIKDKEKVFEEMQFKIAQGIQREQEYKDKIEKMEFLYEPDQTQKKVNQNTGVLSRDRKEDVLQEINRMIEGKQQTRDHKSFIHSSSSDQNRNFAKQEEKSEWLYF